MKFYLILLILIFHIKAYSQFGPKEVISEDDAIIVMTFDLDGDGLQDILARDNDHLKWYKNIDGQGNFVLQQTLSSLYHWRAFYAGDLDGDGDLDIVANSLIWLKPIDFSLISWYENLDGLGTFSDQHEITFTSEFLVASTIVTADIDADGDMDIFTGSHSNFFWYENLNGSGQFSERHILNGNISYLTKLLVIDLDGDGDLDVVGNSNQNGQLIWQENLDGLGNFGDQNIIATELGWINYLAAGDLNGNGYTDLVSISDDLKEVVWHENLDGNGTFGEKHIINTLDHRGIYVFAKDIDNDGDKDVVSSSYNFNPSLGTFSWYENMDGQGSFGTEQIIHQESNFRACLYASDIDNDIDIDLVGGSNSEIVWFENQTILSTDEYANSNNFIYPNPTKDLLTIQNQNGLDIDSVILYDTLGRKVLEGSEVSESIEVSYLTSGLYFIHILTDRGILTQKMVKE